MSKKDYIKLAQALKDSKPFANSIMLQGFDYPSKLSQWNDSVETITLTLEHDNKSFDKARFLNACGYNS